MILQKMFLTLLSNGVRLMLSKRVRQHIEVTGNMRYHTTGNNS